LVLQQSIFGSYWHHGFSVRGNPGRRRCKPDVYLLVPTRKPWPQHQGRFRELPAGNEVVNVGLGKFATRQNVWQGVQPGDWLALRGFRF
jgi:hypothetical protein